MGVVDVILNYVVFFLHKNKCWGWFLGIVFDFSIVLGNYCMNKLLILELYFFKSIDLVYEFIGLIFVIIYIIRKLIFY